jgi:RND family efflux transporter MFP subunit
MSNSAVISDESVNVPERSLPPWLLAVLSLLLLASCDAQTETSGPDITQVRVVSSELTPDLQHVAGTGEIKARVESDLSFKVSGQVISRTVDVGDHVEAGQLLATLDPAVQQADIRSAQAALASQEATLRMAASVLNRRKVLTQTGALSQQELDSALQEYRSAENDLNALRAQLESANDALVQTELRADADGTITARNVEVGQVVQPSTTVFTLAQDGERDAVFNVQESAVSDGAPPLSIEVALVSQPAIRAKAKVREISPTLDRSLGTVRVKLAIENAPPEMTLGSAIVADVVFARAERITLPWQSMFSKAGVPAVWVVDPATKAVELTPVEIERYDATKVVLASGIEPKTLVVVDGGQFLRERQTVSISQEASQ